MAVQTLLGLGVDLSEIRNKVFEMMSGQSDPEFGDAHTQTHFDSAILRGVVRVVGQQLRPDLDAADLDDRVANIADALFNQLRMSWINQGDPL